MNWNDHFIDLGNVYEGSQNDNNFGSIHQIQKLASIIWLPGYNHNYQEPDWVEDEYRRRQDEFT